MDPSQGCEADQACFQKPLTPCSYFASGATGLSQKSTLDMWKLPASLVGLSILKALAFREGSTVSQRNLTTVASDPKEGDKMSAGAGGRL